MDHFLLAYIDPGSGALMLQALVAGAVGFFVFFRQLVTNLTSRLFGRRQANESSTAQLNQTQQ